MTTGAKGLKVCFPLNRNTHGRQGVYLVTDPESITDSSRRQFSLDNGYDAIPRPLHASSCLPKYSTCTYLNVHSKYVRINSIDGERPKK
ncbi:hypothetical protein NXS19_013178 [Fusarium pseudograminearum]|nr:hypothetical protein NXS19_013178 [Fusarium pseudograminearum]